MKFAFAFAVCVALITIGAGEASAAPAVPAESDWRTPDPQNVLVIDTNKGRIIVEMSPLAAPAHVQRVRELARAGFYDGQSFFRVVTGFMDQTGDPKNDGTGGSGKPNLAAEFSFRRDAATPIVVVARVGGVETGFLGSLPVVGQTIDLGLITVDHKVKAWGTFCPGVAGMARSAAEDSANSQFFLMRDATPNLDQKYTAWGRAISGLDVIRAIKVGEPVPAPQDRMLTVRVLADMPAAQRPSVRVIDPAGAWFKATAADVRAKHPDDFTPCDIDLPVQVK
ncbi:MAG TPA: peptidylprolyl isomerase [Caulobacteraceae bacterium]